MTRSESVVKARSAGKTRDGPQSNGSQQTTKSAPGSPAKGTPATPALSGRRARTEKIRFALYLKLALLMGLGWVSNSAANRGIMRVKRNSLHMTTVAKFG